MAIKVQEKKRDDALNRLVPAAASVIRNWWRLRCLNHADRFVSTWKIYKLTQRRVNPSFQQDPKSAPPFLSSTNNRLRTYTNPFKSQTQSPTKTNQIRRKSVNSIEDLPKRYLTAIRMIRILKIFDRL